jgi:hypothetical protein
MDSILVVCYSYTGTSRRLAKLLCSHCGWPLGEIEDAAPRAGAFGTLRCVFDSLLRHRPAIRYDGPDPGDFHTVVVVTPVWLGRLAAPMRSFLALHRAHLQRVAAICTMGSAGNAAAFAEIARMLGHAPIARASFLQGEIEDGSCSTRVIDFGETLQPRSAAAQRARLAA